MNRKCQIVLKKQMKGTNQNANQHAYCHLKVKDKKYVTEKQMKWHFIAAHTQKF